MGLRRGVISAQLDSAYANIAITLVTRGLGSDDDGRISLGLVWLMSQLCGLEVMQGGLHPRSHAGEGAWMGWVGEDGCYPLEGFGIC